MDAGVAIAVRDVNVAVGGDGGFGGPVEGRSRADDAGRVLPVVPRLGSDAGRPERQEQVTIGREFADGVIAAIDDVEEIVRVDRQRMHLLSEQAFAKRGDERAVGLVDEATSLAPGHGIEPIPRIDGHSDDVSMMHI
jgi:hypothetical protein